ncbi:MAG: MauE/DoxX family redox-associated membrane protein [Parvularcula sp.]
MMSQTTKTADQATRGPTMKQAVLYRMVTDRHLCPYGLKSKWLLERLGYEVEDHHLTTRDETDAFKQKHHVATTPQVFIEGDIVGGYEDIRARLTPFEKDSDKKTYTPVLMIFAVSALTAIAVSWGLLGTLFTTRTIELFAAFTMTALALQKLKDVESFSTMFLNYDLLAQHRVGYGYIYPFAEAAAGILMIAGGTAALIGSPIALFIGTVGAASVFKAVYLDKRELKCACVGGDSHVPLGFISLTENLVMMAMGLWMPLKTVMSL